jgi:hypothetical protein
LAKAIGVTIRAVRITGGDAPYAAEEECKNGLIKIVYVIKTLIVLLNKQRVL